jgi:hypothetical protein
MTSATAPRNVATVETAAPAIDPAIDNALTAYPRDVADSARPLIASLLEGAFEVDGHRFHSRLTGDGFPLELAFSTADQDRLRFTVETAPTENRAAVSCESAARRRLSKSREWLDALGEPGSPDVWNALAELQRGGSLTYGAWVGARVDRSRTAGKVYVEVPEGARLPAVAPAGSRLPDRVVVPRMLGYSPSAGVVESYFRIASLEAEHLVGLFAPANLAPLVGSLLDLVEQAYGYRLRGRLPGPSVGVSYATYPRGQRVTLYFYARSLWGSDRRIRTAFARLAGERDWNADLYLAVTEPMASRESWKTFHGLVGLTLDASSDRIELSIGVRPVVP